MQVPTHPLLSLLECKATGLKSMLTHYIDATMDSQFASLRNSFETMIQSGVIAPNSDGTHFGMTLPQPTHTNTHQSSYECSHEYSNDTLTRAQRHQNNLQKEVSLSNNDNQMIKQEFDDDEGGDGEEINDDNIVKCENCKKGICNSVRENYDDTCGDDTETRENGDEHFETNVHDALENLQTNQSIISKDILPNQNKLINTEELIKKECLQVSSITSIPLDFANYAALNDISIDEQIEEQNTQIQTDEFDDNGDVDDDDDYCECWEGKYLNNPNCEVCPNDIFDLDHENINNHLNSDVPVLVEDETNFDKAQSQINFSVTNNTQMNNQNDNNEKCVSERNMEQSTPSTSGVRSSTRKRIQTKVFGDLVQSNGNTHNSGKRKSYQVNESGKKAKSKRILDDDEDTDSDDQELHDHATSAIEEQIATECTTNPIQTNLAKTICRLHCSHCNKSFDYQSNLQRHVRVHSGESPYRCKLCGHTVTRFSDTITHIRMVHFGLPRTTKQQRALNIIDHRDPRELVENV